MQAAPSRPIPPLAALCRDHPLARDLLLSTLFACLTALGAQIRIPLPVVPVTGQVFFVLLTGGFLGGRLAAISMAEYLALGAAGLPVFAGGSGGLAAFLGPTAGYLLAFPVAAYLAGSLIQRCRWRSWLATLAAMLIGVVVIWAGGVVWLAGLGYLLSTAGLPPLPGWLPFLRAGEGHLWRQALLVGLFPFIWVDLAKAILAAQIIHFPHRRLR